MVQLKYDPDGDLSKVMIDTLLGVIDLGNQVDDQVPHASDTKVNVLIEHPDPGSRRTRYELEYHLQILL